MCARSAARKSGGTVLTCQGRQRPDALDTEGDRERRPTKHTSFVVLNAEARSLQIPLDGVSEEDARAMVAPGEWKW